MDFNWWPLALIKPPHDGRRPQDCEESLRQRKKGPWRWRNRPSDAQGDVISRRKFCTREPHATPRRDLFQDVSVTVDIARLVQNKNELWLCQALILAARSVTGSTEGWKRRNMQRKTQWKDDLSGDDNVFKRCLPKGLRYQTCDKRSVNNYKPQLLIFCGNKFFLSGLCDQASSISAWYSMSFFGGTMLQYRRFKVFLFAAQK